MAIFACERNIIEAAQEKCRKTLLTVSTANRQYWHYSEDEN